MTLLTFSVACEKEKDNLDKVSNASGPSNVSATFDITQDNTGEVTITPTANGATYFMVLFGDDAYATPEKYGINESITHTYAEGVYTFQLTAVGISGKTAQFEQELEITFLPPQNLTVTIDQDVTNPFFVSVTASAQYAVIMDVYFGEEQNEDPIHAMPDSTVTHTYQNPGEYIITVIAKSGGSGTASISDTINISEANDPVNLPINFESFTVNYAFTDFGGVTSAVIDNPDPTGINTSSKVAESFKSEGAETWGGTFLTLENPIDFTVNNNFKVKVWSPKLNAMVKLKVENLTNADIWYEVDQFTTTSNDWEEIVYDFSAISLEEEYQKVVIFFDFGNNGDGSSYYFDDIQLVPGNLPTDMPIEDFEGTPPDFTSFGNIADIEIVANPDQSGLNTTANAAKMIKTSGSETWAGAFWELSSPMDLDNYSKIACKTWSATSGIVIKLKIENSDASVTHEVDITNTSANAWEDLAYDFSDAPAADYVRIVIFFDFGNAGNDATYYFDEFSLTN